jgi:hypothetical protein
MLAGVPTDAERALREACDFLQHIQQTALMATRAGELAESIYEQGRYGDAEVWTHLARDSAGSDDLDAALSWRPVQAKILARQGEIDEAEQLARETLELVARTDSVNRHADSFLALAEILGIAGYQKRAEEMIRNALDLYERKGNLASADRARTLLRHTALIE